MRKISLALGAALAVGGFQAHAATLYVGSTQKYKTISAASSAAKSGDTIAIYPGTYSGATIYDSNILIRKTNSAAAGSVVISGKTAGGKGLLLVKGSNVTIDGLRFTGARSTSGNGAGIRQEGHNLTVRNSSFYNNEMGILATPYPTKGGSLTVENSSFDYHKSYASGHIGHSLYANSLDALTVKNSKFTRNFVGHYVKSRAGVNTVTGNTIDDTSGSASYLIDIAEGGPATITGNTLIKGANASNCCHAITYGFEMYKGSGYRNAPGPVSIKDNKFTNKRSSGVTFVSNKSSPVNQVHLYGNTLNASSGTIKTLSGAGSVNTLVM